MKVVHVTTLHPSDDARIAWRECWTLAKAGHDVHLVARGRTAPPGVTLHPLDGDVRPGLPSLARRLHAAKEAGLAVGGDVFHLHDGELLGMLPALKARRRRVVYDVHEDRPRELLAFASRRAVARSLSASWAAAEFAAGLLVDAVVAATPGIAARFPAAKTALVRNFPVREEVEAFAGPPLADREPLVLYVGNITALRGARELVNAVAQVETPGVRLALAGSFAPASLRDELARLPGWPRVEELGWLDRDGVAHALHRARVGLVTLHEVAIHVDALPVKLFEYMAAGIPVVASDFPSWRAIVEEAGCGLLVDPLDPAAIARAVDELLADPGLAEEMGRRGREAVQSRYSWEPEGERLLALYDRLAG
jgi:glycosyltransferase involved in cell wall biosynthesis